MSDPPGVVDGRLSSSSAGQQPEWEEDSAVAAVRAELAALPPLVGLDEVATLGKLLAEVAAGELQVIQAGDCAEDLRECEPDFVSRKVGLLDSLAGLMRANSGKPVIRVGRIAGQFAKPRSNPTERRGDVELPAFRGLLVNGPEFDRASRRPDPRRMLTCHHAAARTLDFLRSGTVVPGEPAVWASHEALVLDYELPQVHRDHAGRPLLTSTHWPWIGDRTRRLDGAHVGLLASVANPVACKIGPGVSPAEAVALAAALDPDRIPGRLTFIARMGANLVADRLPDLVAAMRAAGRPVIWLCDPMHGNTISVGGRKTRLLPALRHEVTEFQRVLAAQGVDAGGLHLETTPLPVRECLESEQDDANGPYTTLCDPRLNTQQALGLVEAWTRVAVLR
ncbi:3-deoxy-7-phosphoheptulonate synthase [Kutzneria sp. NPDC051319]|uniref:3-deoxy-7-phosphoheptulonate synthase n=1 Tax=Kutzneria sp. NPDC051319 TaxID=3155047 RepID=UPI0034153965